MLVIIILRITNWGREKCYYTHYQIAKVNCNVSYDNIRAFLCNIISARNRPRMSDFYIYIFFLSLNPHNLYTSRIKLKKVLITTHALSCNAFFVRLCRETHYNFV